MSDRIIPHDDPILLEHYSELVRLFPNAVFIEDAQGVYRFQRNALIDWIVERDRERAEASPRDRYGDTHYLLNDMARAYHGDAPFTLAEYMQFNQDMGYSLGGYYEVFEPQIRDLMKELG